MLVPPARELWTDRRRAGIGRLSQRPDLAVLAVVLVFGALANAGAMVAPVVRQQDAWQASLGWSSAWVVSAMFVLALGGRALGRHRSGRVGQLPLEPFVGRAEGAGGAIRLVAGAVGFRLLAGPLQFSFLYQLCHGDSGDATLCRPMGCGWLGTPRWSCSCCGAVADWIVRAEIVFLDLGLLASLYVVYRIAAGYGESFFARMRTAIPWAGLVSLLFAVGVWILLQPMEMRGTIGAGPAALAVTAAAGPTLGSAEARP